MKNLPIQRSITATALFVAAALALSACQADTREQRRAAGEVILNLGTTPKTLDPGLSVDVNSTRAIMCFIRGLTILDSNGEAHPEIAERWDVSEDGRVYDFYLRETTWSNGESVTAEDFAYALIDRELNPEFGSEYAYMLFYLEGAQDYYEGKTKDRGSVGIEVVGPLHLRFRLVGPAPFFPQLVAHHTYFPVCRSVDRENPDWALRADTYVGNGPFKLESYATGDKFVGVKREEYWNAGEVHMNKITFRFIEEETTERIAFDNREIDGTYLAPRPDIPELSKGDALRIAVQHGVYYLNLNMELPIFEDVRVRRALNLAIDRPSIVRYVSRAKEIPAYSVVPPQLYGGKGKAYFEAPDYEEARRLLAEAGYPGGQGFPRLRYLYNTLEVHRSVAQVIQESWKRELGIETLLENQEFRVVIENRNQGNYDVARNGWIADFADPMNFLDIFHSLSGNNNSRWHDAEFDRLLETARAEPDPEKRLELLHTAEDRLMADLPIVPIWFYTHPYLTAPELEGYDLSPMNTIDVAKLRWKP